MSEHTGKSIVDELDERASGLEVAQHLARQVIEACELEGGVEGTLVSAFYDAWHMGKHGRYPAGSPAEEQ